MSIWMWILFTYLGVAFVVGIIFSVVSWKEEGDWSNTLILLPFICPFFPIAFFLIYFRPKLKIKSKEVVEMERQQLRENRRRNIRRKYGFHMRGFDRLRVNTDGPGICTLVVLDECPLDCKYCLNPHAKEKSERFVLPAELFNMVKDDNPYFIETGGGITFGGGEPLLQSDKIRVFKKLCPEGWSLNIETSLYVEWQMIENVIDVVDRWIIDIKDMDYDVYHNYTGKYNALVIENLKLMIGRGLADKMYVRAPRIPGYNNEENIDDSVRFLHGLGLTNIEVFDYVTDRKQYLNRSLPAGKVNMNVWRRENEKIDLTYFARPSAEGKEKCEYLKTVRRAIATKYKIDYEASPCYNEGGCIGTCPACDGEIKALNRLTNSMADAPVLSDDDDTIRVSRLQWQIWKSPDITGVFGVED